MFGRRKKQIIMMLVLFGVVASLSVGFAAFSASLNIASNASVRPNSDAFGVMFSNSASIVKESDVMPNASSVGVVATDGKIVNGLSPRISNLHASFSMSGQYVEYVFYAINTGEYNAYLNNINFVGNKI